jgi:hypothetical protein
MTLLAVPCRTCGVAAGMPCLLSSGRLRNDPHLDRKLDAIEAVETKKDSPSRRSIISLDQNNSKYVEGAGRAFHRTRKEKA